MIELQVENGAQMGDFCRSPRTAVNMAMAISEVIHQDLIQAILTAEADLSMIVDGSTGNDGTHYVSVIFQFVGKCLFLFQVNRLIKQDRTYSQSDPVNLTLSI